MFGKQPPVCSLNLPLAPWGQRWSAETPPPVGQGFLMAAGDTFPEKKTHQNQLGRPNKTE